MDLERFLANERVLELHRQLDRARLCLGAQQAWVAANEDHPQIAMARTLLQTMEEVMLQLERTADAMGQSVLTRPL